MLTDPAVSEVGGEHTNEGVDYARYLAMALIVEEERKKVPDYAIVFEYLQDLMILDSPTAPTAALLIQVKKKATGSWTKGDLCRIKREKAAAAAPDAPKAKSKVKGLGAQSPLGKLYSSVEALRPAAHTTGLFASNAAFDLLHSSGSKVAPHTRTVLSDLHADESKHLGGKLHKELKLKAVPTLEHLGVEQLKIIPVSMRDTVRGVLSTYLTDLHPALADISGRLQENLLEAFSSRSGVTTVLGSLEEIVQRKGFTRAAFNDAIQRLAGIRPAPEQLDEVIEGLKSENYPSREANRLSKQVTKLQIQMVQKPETKEAILWQTALDTARHHQAGSHYMPALHAIEIALEAKAKQERKKFPNEGGARAVAVLAIMHVDQEPAPASPVPADQDQ